MSFMNGPSMSETMMSQCYIWCYLFSVFFLYYLFLKEQQFSRQISTPIFFKGCIIRISNRWCRVSWVLMIPNMGRFQNIMGILEILINVVHSYMIFGKYSFHHSLNKMQITFYIRHDCKIFQEHHFYYDRHLYQGLILYLTFY